MKEYSLNKYKFYRHNDTTIAISTYGGREVKGYAKVDPRDSYDEQFGKELAAARCNAKIANKRLERASMKRSDAIKALHAAQEQVSKMQDYYDDAALAASIAESNVTNLLFNN